MGNEYFEATGVSRGEFEALKRGAFPARSLQAAHERERRAVRNTPSSSNVRMIRAHINDITK